MIIKIIRALGTGFFFSFFGIGALMIGTICFPFIDLFCKKPRPKKNIIKLNLVRQTWRFFLYLLSITHLAKLRLENFPSTPVKSSIIIANHPSLLDVVFMISTFKNSSCIIKSSLRKNIFLYFLIKDIYIFNDDPLETIIDKSRVLLENEANIIVFPEGTRTIPGNPTRLHKSFILIAHKTSHNILPVHISQSFPVLHKHQPWYDVGDRCVVYNLKVLPYINVSNYNQGTTRQIVTSIKEDVIKTLYSSNIQI